MYRVAVKKLSRYLLRKSTFLLPGERQIAIERRHRGREQYARLAEADCTIVSHGKSGRTWLRVLLSHVYHQRCGLPETALISHDNFHRRNAAVPRVFFTHDNYLRDFTGHARPIEDYRGHRVVLLVRHPADVTVSQYFQWRFRMRTSKKGLLDYPPHGADIELEDFLRRTTWGVDRVIDFLNLWARDLAEFDDLLLLRYEDLRADTAGSLCALLDFLGTPAPAQDIDAAVAFGSVDNMRRLEQQGGFRGTGRRMRPGDPDNPESFKVRRAKVGGWRDYFDDDTVAWVEERIDARLDPVYGYGRPRPVGQAQS